MSSCTKENPCYLIVCDDCQQWTKITDVHINPVKPEPPYEKKRLHGRPHPIFSDPE